MKNNLFLYKGYHGSIKVQVEDNCLFGQVLYITDLITYEADTIPELEKEFKISVNEYLILFKKLNEI